MLFDQDECWFSRFAQPDAFAWAAPGEELLADYEFKRVIADRSYDADDFLHFIADQDAEAIIPPRKNRTEQREYDKHWYKERHLVECFFNKIKHYRRLFSRFEKLDKRHLGFLSFAGALIWLR